MKNKNIKTKHYDIVISIGQNCFVSRVLRILNLRIFACPLDWVRVHNYSYAIKILKDKFENYYNKEDLILTGTNEEWNTDIYVNNKNKTTFIHDFLKNSSKNFDKAYNKSKEKYERRIKRLLKKLKNGAKVCLIYAEWQPLSSHNTKITNEIIKNDIKELNEIYKGCYFDIFYIKHNENFDTDKYVINDKICELNNSPTNDILGNIDLVSEIINKKIKLKFLSKTMPYIYRIKRLIKICKTLN